MKYLFTGGTGLIGSKLISELTSEGHEVHNLSRGANNPFASLPGGENVVHHQWNGKKIPNEVGTVDVVINLAGASIGKRWSDAYKKIILDSRVDATTACTDYIKSLEVKPKVFISASGYNYYGNLFTKTKSETDPVGEGFMPHICKVWEAAAEGTGVRTVKLRTSVVLDKEDGPLAQMITPYRFFVGGPTGTGRQGFPWIHLDDMVRAIRFIVATPDLNGPVNMVAPHHGSNQEFSDALAKVMHRPNFFRLPESLLQIIFGEMSVVLWGGGFVSAQKLEDHGFNWIHPNIEEALENLLKD
jgi:hypothetical protein